MYEEIWKAIRGLETEVSMLQATLARLENNDIHVITTSGGGPEANHVTHNPDAPYRLVKAAYMDEGTPYIAHWKSEDKTFKGICNRPIYSAENSLCEDCGGHLSLHKE